MRSLFLSLLLTLTHPATADPRDDSIEQLRYAIGSWNVVTEFIGPDGEVTRAVDGTYDFEWVLEDKLVSGVSELPAIGLKSALLFYIDEADEQIEMISVGPDGKLWIMNGPFGDETRYSQEYETADGKTAQLRFTRYNVSPDRFESRMEYSTDGGASWQQGNHQLFERAMP